MAKKVAFGRRSLDVVLDADVVVCGGGSAGLAAAVAAARAGASVVVIEQTGCLGGLGTAGFVPCFCPYTDGEKPVVRGIGEEVLKRLAKAMGVPLDYDWFNIHAESLKTVMDEMLAESGAALRYFTRIVDVVGDGRIEAVVISTHAGLKAVTGKVFIEATGDGDVAAWGGADFEVGDADGRTQAPSLCNLFANVDWEEFWRHKEAGAPRPDQVIWKKHVDEGRAPVDEFHLAAGVLQTGATLGETNMGHIYEVDCLDEAALTQAIIDGRKQAWTFLRWYRENVPGFAGAELAATGAIMGVRETRRILGEYVLGIEDYRVRRSFPDEIGRLAYPVDVHSSTAEGRSQMETHRLIEETRLAKGESYGIPYRCLIPKKIENMLVTGRCVSTDRMVQGSLRVMPGCFVTGQAAGAAAAMAARKKGGAVRDVDTGRLRETLAAQGAYLP